MNRRTWTIIGAAVALIGLGIAALALVDQEGTVRHLADVIAEPNGHRSGTFVLIGTPQPPTLASPNGDQPNPLHANETTTVTAWNRAGLLYHSTHRIHVSGPGAEGVTTWTYTNTTQVAGQPDTAEVATDSWQLREPHTLFLIRGVVPVGNEPFMWGVYKGILPLDIQPKPSQFEGRLASSIGGHPLPAGALVFEIDDYTAGCSSKFLPPEHEPSADL